MSPSEYERLKKAADEQAALAERKKGELSRIVRDLKRECGDGDPEKALRRLEKDLDRAESEYAKARDKFEKDHPGVV